MTEPLPPGAGWGRGMMGFGWRHFFSESLRFLSSAPRGPDPHPASDDVDRGTPLLDAGLSQRERE